MKKALFFALFSVLFQLAAQAQTKDTIWVFQQGGTYYQARYSVQYPEEIQTTVVTPIGTSAQAAARFKQSVLQEAQRLRNDANIIIGYRDIVTQLDVFVGSCNNSIGAILYDSLYGSINLFDRDWLINGESISFRRAEFGEVEWRQDTSAGWRIGAYIGGILRLKEFNGHTTDFFLWENDKLRSLDTKYTIEPLEQASRRSRPVPAAPVSNTDTVTLMDGGRVKTGLGIFKYNTKLKKWQKE